MNITVILPFIESNEVNNSLLMRAINSYESCKTDSTKLLMVTTDAIKEEYKDLKCDFLTLSESEPTTFSHLVNKAVEYIDSEYFSILEFDDVYTKNVFINAEKYQNSGYEASVYMPLTEAVDYTSGDIFGYMNMEVLATSFSEELNYLDMKCIFDYPDMNFTGAIFNRSDFVKCGKLKESMKLHFWHEYVLRSLNSGVKYFVVPKVGYRHFVNRPDSLYGKLNQTITVKESGWWLDLAQKEYLFKKDRNKTYEE